MYSEFAINNSLNLKLTDLLLNQIWQLFSYDNLCQFLSKSNVVNRMEVQRGDLIYDYIKMREHLIACFEPKKLQHFRYMKKAMQKKLLYTKKHILLGTSLRR